MKMLGIILAGGNNAHMKALTDKRAIAAMPVAASYRAIDFTLSNMTNSNIDTVAVLGQYHFRSLSDHLNSSKWWNFGSKQGGLYLFTPIVTATNSWWYRGTADAMWQNIEFLKDRHEPYVVIANADGVYKADFEKILNYHIDKQAEITVVCSSIPADDDSSRFGTVSMDDSGRIIKFEEKPALSSADVVSAGIYIMRRRKLIDFLEESNEEGRYNFVTDILTRRLSTGSVYGYRLEGYWSSISTVESYYRTNMDFLKPEVREHFFEQGSEIYTKALDVPPTKFNEGSSVVNSLVGSGSIINSNVENSVLFKKVFVGNNCTIKNSIILHGAYIGDNVRVENCIVEANETLLGDTDYIGEKGIRIISERNNSNKT